MTFHPDITNPEILEAATGLVGIKIMEMQNENPCPEGGTLGFVMGTAFALGNMAAVYVQGASRNERRQFEKILVGMVKDAFREPVVTGTLLEGQVH